VAGDISLSAGGTLTVQLMDGTDTSIVANRDLNLVSGATLRLDGMVSAKRSLGWTCGYLDFAGRTVDLSIPESIRIQSNASFKIGGMLEAGKDITLISANGSVWITGTIRGRSGDTLDSLTIIAQGNQVQSGILQGRFRFKSISNGETYYEDTPDMNKDSQVFDSSNKPVFDLADLDLVPYLTALASVIKDPQTGMDVYTDPNTAKLYYYLRLPGESGPGSFWQPEMNGLYGFTGYNLAKATVSGGNGFEMFYSTTADPAMGILYEADGVTPINQNGVVSLKPYYLPVTDTVVIGRLVQMTVKDMTGGQMAGSSITLDQGDISVNESITLVSQGQVVVLGSLGVSGVLNITSGQDLLFGDIHASSIHARSNGLVDANGNYSAGTVTVPGPVTNPMGGTLQTLDVTAHSNLVVNTSLTAVAGIALRAGNAIVGQPGFSTAPGAGCQEPHCERAGRFRVSSGCLFQGQACAVGADRRGHHREHWSRGGLRRRRGQE